MFFIQPRQYIYKEKTQNGNLRLDLNYHTGCCFCTQLWTAKYVLLYEKKNAEAHVHVYNVQRTNWMFRWDPERTRVVNRILEKKHWSIWRKEKKSTTAMANQSIINKASFNFDVTSSSWHTSINFSKRLFTFLKIRECTTPPVAEILSVENGRAIVVCGFLMK